MAATVKVLRLLLAVFPVVANGEYDAVHHIASARLYGNIDSFAYYYVDLLIGTPPQRVSVIVDTGSGVTAFPCKSCKHCGQHIDPNFDFDSSSSAKWIGCGATCRSSCLDGKHCSYHQGYTEGSSITGWYFRDQVRLGDANQRNPPVGTTMGCHQDENKLFYTQKANGIMGIRPPSSRGSPTILQELFADKAHIDTQTFALCLAEWGGRMVVGGYNASYHTGSIEYIHLGTQRGYYDVPLTKMVLNGRVLSTQYRSAMIDSGTTYTYMATAPYQALRQAIEDHCHRHDCRATVRGTCWEAPRGLDRFPTVEVWFNSVKTQWVPKAYLFRKGSGTRWCYAFEDDGPSASTVLGASWMMHQDIIFDLRASRVGVVPATCPEFKDRPTHDPSVLYEKPPGGGEAVEQALAAYEAAGPLGAEPAELAQDPDAGRFPASRIPSSDALPFPKSPPAQGKNLYAAGGLVAFSGVLLLAVCLVFGDGRPSARVAPGTKDASTSSSASSSSEASSTNERRRRTAGGIIVGATAEDDRGKNAEITSKCVGTGDDQDVACNDEEAPLVPVPAA